MHSHLLRSAPRQLAITRRRIGRRTKPTTAPMWHARQRPPVPWVDLEAELLHSGRAPEESYRDYIFRQGIGP
jgi:hypothetical protein